MEELYNQLYKDGKYTKTFEDFQNQFGTPEKSEKLYTALNEAGDYTKSFDDFKAQFVLAGKTNDSAAADPNAESEKNDMGSKLEDGLSEQQSSSILDFFSGVKDNIKSRIKDEEVQAPDDANQSYLIGRGVAENPQGFFEAAGKGFPGFLSTSYNLTVGGLADLQDMMDVLKSGIAMRIQKGKFSLTPEENAEAKEFGLAIGKATRAGLGSIGAASGLDTEKIKETEKKLQENLPQYETTISEEMAKGTSADWSTIAGRIVEGSLTSAPYTIMSLNPYTAAYMGLSISGDKFMEEVEENPERAHWKLIGNAGTTGGIEMLDALITRRLLKAKGLLGKGKNAEKAIKNMNKSLSRKALGILGIGVQEGATEAGQAILTKINDYLWLGDLPGQDEQGKITEKGFIKTLYEIADEAIIGAFTGGSMATVGQVAQGNKVLEDRAKSLLTPDSVKKDLVDLRKQYTERQLEIAKAKKEGNNRRAGALKNINEKIAVRINRTAMTSSLVLDNLTKEELIQYARNIDQMRALKQGGNVDSNIKNDISNLQDANNKIFQEALKRNFGENMSFTQASAQQLGLNAIIANDINEFNKLVGTKKGKLIKDKDGVAGAFIGDGKIVINKTTALNQGDVTVGSHEILHPILNAMIGDAKAQQKIVEDFKKTLNRRERNWTENEIKRKLGDDIVGSPTYYTEYINIFSEGLVSKNVNFDSNVFEKIKDFLTRLFKGAGFDNIDFKTGRGVYNFIKAYGDSVKTGKLSEKALEALDVEKISKVGAVGEKQLSKTQLEGVKKRLSDIPAADVESRTNVNKISAELSAMIGTQINNKFSNLDPDTREEFTFDVLEKILRPNKEGVNKDLQWDGRGELYGFLNGRIGLRIRDAVREDYKRPAAERMYVGRIDAKQLEDLTREPATEPTTEAAPKKKTTTTEESVERGQATFDELDIVDDVLIKDIKSELEKEIRVRAQKGTLSETVSVKKGRNTYIVSWLEDYINKQLFKKLLKKVGAIKGTYPNTVIPSAYIDFLQDPKTFEIITKALPIKSIKKSYGKLFDIERVGREETAEGNPVFRIKKIDKTKFFKYFVDGKKSTILERQKQLFREILTPIAKQAVAEYTTIENLEKLKSIQSLAPATSVDVVNKISLDAALNNLESQIDRYKGEATGFDIIQFSLNKQERSQIAEKLDLKSDSNITMAQIEAQVIAQTLRPLVRERKAEIKDIEYKLGPELFEKLQNTVIGPYLDSLQALQDKKAYARGTFAEQLAWDAFKNIKGVKMVSKRPDGKAGSSAPDIVINHKGQDIIFEIKSRRSDRITSVNIYNYTDSKNYKTTRNTGTESEKVIFDQIKKSKNLNNFVSKVKKMMDKFYPGEKYLDKNGYVELTPEQIVKLDLKNSLYKETVTYIEGLNEKLVETIYNEKGANYVGFVDIGSFYVGNNKNNLSVPKFEADLYSRAWLYMGQIKKNGKHTFPLRMFAQISTESSKKLGEAKTDSIINSNSIKTILQPSLTTAQPIEFKENEAFAGSKSGFFTINDIEYVGALTGFNVLDKEYDNTGPLFEKLQQLTGKKNVATDKYQLFTFDRNDAGAEIVSRAEDTAEWNGKRWVYPESDTKQSLAVFGSLSNYFLNEIKKGNLDGLIFSGAEPSRQRLYNTLSERFAKKLGWNYGVIEKPTNRGGNTYFIAKPAKIQFSKTKYNWDPFDMADVVTMSLFGKTKAFQNREAYMRTYKYLTPAQQAEVRTEMKKHKLLQFSKTLNKAKAMVNRPDAPQKGISVWDFDDTLATTKSNVLYTLPDGTKGKINATEFALKADKLAAKGAEFDFSEFKKVMEGAKGPMFDKAVARNKKFGNDNVFILTARPADSKYAIHDFLSAIGLNIKIENIVGLGDGTAIAKAKWIIGKVAEGYNDFYFADDAYKNVKAVQEVLEVADVKSKVHQAKVQFSKNLNKEFNKIVEDVTGISAKEKISKARGKVIGKNKGRFKFFIPPSADDFSGLLYKLLGKGKKGEQQQAWFKKALFDPFAKGIREFESYKQNVTNIVNQLKKDVKNIPAGLKKENKTGFTNENAVRVYLWAKNGFDIDGLNAKDIKELVDFVKNNPELMDFADQLDALLEGYPEPQNDWLAGTITTDAINMINTTKRAGFLEAWQQNADAIFSEDNLNKLRAAFGDNYVEALQDVLYRMKTGRNRPSGANKLTNKFMNWVNDSVGTIMFFNTRSALLQTLSTVNFINWGDNNPIAAAKAFANQKQFWSDFAMLFNSDFLKQRRSGLKNDVNADDIANAAETATNKTKAVLSSILKMGFLPTQMADSFAIALGGASFVRNRMNTYISEGLSKQEAQEKAFLDFQEIAEETQQSSRPDRISQQQASPLGRIILAFANTPMQYMRLTKKAFLDLKNGRGDAKTNITKIAYYMAVQNIIFSALQGALFAAMFDDDDEELDNKQMRVANSMADSILRGVGVYGAIASTLKNIVLEIKKQSEKPRPDFTVAAQRALSISPPIDSKMRKLMSAARAFSYKTTREKMKGYGLDNPAYYAVGQIVSAGTNVPLDRLIRKTDNIRVALDNDTKYWQSVALLLGYSQWDVGLVETSKSKSKKKKSFGNLIKYKPSRLTKEDLIKLKNKK